jgi:hypothetical protein
VSQLLLRLRRVADVSSEAVEEDTVLRRNAEGPDASRFGRPGARPLSTASIWATAQLLNGNAAQRGDVKPSVFVDRFVHTAEATI